MKKKLEKLIKEVVLSLKLADEKDFVDFSVDFPKDEKMGDYSTNITLILAKKIGKNPIDLAEEIVNSIKEDIFEKIEVAKPGFINFYLSKKYFQDLVEKINSEKANFGNSKIGEGIKINNEFISANPTGPLHLGNGRGGFFGDSLSRILQKSGFSVMSEYYINDGGVQVEKLGHSVLKDGEAVYAGEYIDELNKKYGKLSSEEAGEKAVRDVLENIIKKTTGEKMKIHFDAWVSEQKNIVAENYPEKAIAIFQEKKLTFEEDGALWFRSTEFGDDKDRVLVKSDGAKTYFAIDCGYILNKIERGFQKMIVLLGADHHGYKKRFVAATKALGAKEDPKIVICQLVRLIKDGKEVRMSKRAGNVVYIDDLIEKVGHDVVRFFFLMYSPDTHLNFDLGLAEEKSQKNPVFYVQYAHARICSILEKYKLESKKYKLSDKDINLSLLRDEKEINLIKELAKFPEVVEEVAQNYNVQKLPQYAIKIADKFHSFYNACQVIDEENLELTKARLKLVLAVKIVLGETLRLIGVEAPNKM